MRRTPRQPRRRAQRRGKVPTAVGDEATVVEGDHSLHGLPLLHEDPLGGHPTARAACSTRPSRAKALRPTRLTCFSAPPRACRPPPESGQGPLQITSRRTASWHCSSPPPSTACARACSGHLAPAITVVGRLVCVATTASCSWSRPSAGGPAIAQRNSQQRRHARLPCSRVAASRGQSSSAAPQLRDREIEQTVVAQQQFPGPGGHTRAPAGRSPSRRPTGRPTPAQCGEACGDRQSQASARRGVWCGRRQGGPLSAEAIRVST